MVKQKPTRGRKKIPRKDVAPKAPSSESESAAESDSDAAAEVEKQLEEELPTITKKPKKKSRPAVKMTGDEEASMVEFLQANPCFYDKSKREWSDPDIRNRRWNEQAEHLQRCPDELARWFVSIRTRLSRIRSKIKLGQAASTMSERDQ